MLLNEWSLLRGKEQVQKWEFIVGPRFVHHLNGLHLRLNFGGQPSEGQEGEEIAKARPKIQRITVPGTLKKKKKRVSRRKDKSTESYSAERMRKLRTKKKGGVEFL